VAFEDGERVKLDTGEEGIYWEDFFGKPAPEGRIWVEVYGEVAAVDPSEVTSVMAPLWEAEAKRKGSRKGTMNREAQILQAMSKATLREQQVLASELDELRRDRRARIEADRSIDIANAVIRDTLTPVIPHQFTSEASDWLGEVEAEASRKNYDHDMRVKATLWFKKVSREVKEDRDEFAQQAMGVARVESGQFGVNSGPAYQAFLDHVARLYRQAEMPPGEVDKPLGDQSGHGESTVTDYDTQADQEPMWGDEWDGEPDTASEVGSGYHPELPGAGEGENSVSSINEVEGRRIQGQEVGDTVTYQGKTYQVANEFAHKGTDQIALIDPSNPYDVIWVDRTEVKQARRAFRLTADEGQTCSVCGDSIEKDPEGEEPRTWHHNNGESHDHEAEPSSGGESEESSEESKEARRKLGEATTEVEILECGHTISTSLYDGPMYSPGETIGEERFCGIHQEFSKVVDYSVGPWVFPDSTEARRRSGGWGKGRGGQAAPIRGGRKTAQAGWREEANGAWTFSAMGGEIAAHVFQGSALEGDTSWSFDVLGPDGRRSMTGFASVEEAKNEAEIALGFSPFQLGPDSRTMGVRKQAALKFERDPALGNVWAFAENDTALMWNRDTGNIMLVMSPTSGMGSFVSMDNPAFQYAASEGQFRELAEDFYGMASEGSRKQAWSDAEVEAFADEVGASEEIIGKLKSMSGSGSIVDAYLDLIDTEGDFDLGTEGRRQAQSPPWMPMPGDRVTVNGKEGEVIDGGSSGAGFYTVKFDDGWTTDDISRSDMTKVSQRTAGFWENISAQISQLQSAKSADDVISILGPPDPNIGVGDAFFEGGGGDEDVYSALMQAGWRTIAFEAPYYWAMEAPDGSVISYVEGDIYRGNQLT
jgi:hypothetical protein